MILTSCPLGDGVDWCRLIWIERRRAHMVKHRMSEGRWTWQAAWGSRRSSMSKNYCDMVHYRWLWQSSSSSSSSPSRDAGLSTWRRYPWFDYLSWTKWGWDRCCQWCQCQLSWRYEAPTGLRALSLCFLSLAISFFWSHSCLTRSRRHTEAPYLQATIESSWWRIAAWVSSSWQSYRGRRSA